MADAVIDLELELDVQVPAAWTARPVDPRHVDIVLRALVLRGVAIVDDGELRGRIQDFVPILVERAVLDALRRNRHGDGTAADGGAGFIPSG